jgi:hypothetical protein
MNQLTFAAQVQPRKAIRQESHQEYTRASQKAPKAKGPISAPSRPSLAADQATSPRALFAADHRRSISFTAIFMLGRYFRAATSGGIDDEKKIRFRLTRTGPPPGIASAMAPMPPTDDA